MKTKLTRREFLKLMALASLHYAVPSQAAYTHQTQPNSNRENVLIIVFDAWSASHLSFCGYERQTTPQINRLMESAVVYHNHYAGGHFTTPGTTSLLTGTHSWQHRAFGLFPTLDDDLVRKNIFRAFDQHYRFAYSHNPLADHLLKQFMGDLDHFESWEKLYFESNPMLTLFKHDQDTATLSWSRAMQLQDDVSAYSLFLSRFFEYHKAKKLAAYEELFPRGVPNSEGHSYFTLEQGIARLFNLTQTVSQPFLGYYHFLPPHHPYNTRKDFFNYFQKDGYIPPKKSLHIFQNTSPEFLKPQRRWYDEFILYIDAEFVRFYQQLERSGLLENTWIVLTSDHGEMFERGIWGHSVPLFYRPLTHIPLIIFPPGQQERIDVYERTSAADILPTLLSVTKQEVPAWSDGVVLPPFGASNVSGEREISAVQVEDIVDGEIQAATAMAVKDTYKAMWLFGYDEMGADAEIIELYDLEADPEELYDLSASKQEIAAELVDLLRKKIERLKLTFR
jgi:arylsulfatase A-like enzyme